MALSYTEVSICNLALLELGEQTITSLNEDNNRARFCKQFYAQTRDAVLRAHPWNFATIRRALVPLVQPVVEMGDGLTHQFPLPTDALRILATDFFDQRKPFKIESSPDVSTRVLVAGDDKVTIRYIKQVTDPTLFDSLFVEALVARLASRLAIPIRGDRAMGITMWQSYLMKLAEARTMDGMEGTPDEVVVDDLTVVRHGLIGDRRSGWLTS